MTLWKSLPLTREVAFAKQMTEGETGRIRCSRRQLHGADAGLRRGPQNSYLLCRRKLHIIHLAQIGQGSLISLLRLSPPNPRLSPPGFGGGPKNS